ELSLSCSAVSSLASCNRSLAAARWLTNTCSTGEMSRCPFSRAAKGAPSRPSTVSFSKPCNVAGEGWTDSVSGGGIRQLSHAPLPQSDADMRAEYDRSGRNSRSAVQARSIHDQLARSIGGSGIIHHIGLRGNPAINGHHNFGRDAHPAEMCGSDTHSSEP